MSGSSPIAWSSPAARRCLANFAGVPQATLQQWLIDAQQALHDLTIGGKVQVVLYNSGEGSRQVTYSRTSIGQLNAYIQALATALGVTRPRQPFRVRF